MSEQDLREALRGLASPAHPPPRAREVVMARLARRRRFRGILVSGTAAVMVLGVVFASASVLHEDGRTAEPSLPRPPGAHQPQDHQPGTFLPIAPSPLLPRHDAVGVWTGSEMLVVGGTTGPPCPPTADCAGPSDDTLRSDGAAYDPATDTWQAIPAAPRPVVGGLAAWSGTEMVVVTGGVTLAYDPLGESWRYLDPPPDGGFNQTVVTDQGIVFGSYDKRPRSGMGSDWLLDPLVGTWLPMPADPFGESYDRSLAWDGERLWLLSMSVANHSKAYGGAASRVAVLEDGAWRVVSATPPMVYGQQWWFFEGLLVAPVSSASPNARLGVFVTPGSTEWSSIPIAAVDPDDGLQECTLPPIGPGPEWLAGGGPVLTSLDPLATTVVPPCAQLALPDVAVWSGDQLIIWGGIAAGYEDNVNIGLTWRPPPPS